MRNIQSNSYASFSNTILEKWILFYSQKIDSLRSDNLSTAVSVKEKLAGELNKFKIFAKIYTDTVIELARKQEGFDNLENAKKNVFSTWISSEIGKALDIYWAPLSQIASQYASTPYFEILLDSKLQQTIDDYLLKLNKLIGKQDIKLPGILLYFDEITLIHYLPYTDIAYVSIPFRIFESAPSLDDKLRSIAHELGHYLFWHMADFIDLDQKQTEFLKMLREDVIRKEGENEWSLISPWVEEIFADVVGTLISGERYFTSSKDLVLQKNGIFSDKLVENDYEHVPDILRPFVASYTLFKQGLFVNALGEWKEFLGQLSVPPDNLKIIGQNQNNRDIRRSPEQLITSIQIVIDHILESIEKFRQNQISPFEFTFKPSIALEEKAKLFASMNHKTYEILLTPTILEAGESGTTHKHGSKPSQSPRKHSHSDLFIEHTHT